MTGASEDGRASLGEVVRVFLKLGDLGFGGPAALLAAGACFIRPAFAIVLACAWAYLRFGTLLAARGSLSRRCGSRGRLVTAADIL